MKATTLVLAMILGTALCAGENPTAKLQDKLAAKDFWETIGSKKNLQWKVEDLKALEEIGKTSNAPTLRLRANKMLVDHANKGRFTAGQEEIVVGAFKHLEANMVKGAVHQMCVEVGFSHYTVTKQGTGAAVFLIERVGQDFNGGLNLGWDMERKAVSTLVQWGGINK